MKLLRRFEVADKLGVSDRTVDNMIRDGRLPGPFKRKGVVLWDEAEIEAAIRAWRDEPKTEQTEG
jgi:excisionase family DNA binding protein